MRKFDCNFNFASRANPVPKPDRTGDYHRMGDHQMVDYGPASYVPGDRWASWLSHCPSSAQIRSYLIPLYTTVVCVVQTAKHIRRDVGCWLSSNWSIHPSASLTNVYIVLLQI